MIDTKKALLILFAVMFLVMIGFGIIIPVLPFFAEELGANPTELGFLMAVYSITQLIFAPMWGKISDRIGRKPVILIGILGLSLSFFLTGLASSLWMLFAARIAGGFLSAANLPTVMAYAADITSNEDRGKGMGVIGAATGLGFVFGPAVGGIFSKISLSMPFYVAGASSLVTFLLVWFFLKESLSKEQRENLQVKEKMSWRKTISSPHMILYSLQLFVSLSMAGLEATFAYFAKQKAGLGTVELGYIFMIMGLASAFVQGGVIGKLTRRFGEGPVIQAGVIISAAGFGLILLIDSFLTAAVCLTIFGIGNGIIRPSVSALLTKSSGAKYGTVSGLLSSFDSFGRIIGPPLGGWLFTIAIGLPYLSGILLSIIAFVLYQMYILQEKKEISSSVN